MKPLLRSNTYKYLLNINLVFLFLCRKLKEDKEEIEEQRRLRQEEEERSLVTVSFFKNCFMKEKKGFQNCLSNPTDGLSDIIQEAHTKVIRCNLDRYCHGKTFDGVM